MSAAHPLRGPVSDALHEVPLRLRLVAVTVGLLITALSVAGLAASYRLDSFVVSQKSDELHAAAPQVLDEVYSSLLQMPTEPATVPYNVYVVTIMPGGSAPEAGSPSQPAIPSIARDHPYVATHQSFIVNSYDGRSRWIAAAYPGPTSSSTVTVAISLSAADETVERMRWSTVVISIIAAVVSAVLGWFLIRRAFRPLTQIEDTAQAIAEGDLTRRVPDTTTRDEISSLATSLNLMLSRIEQSFAVRTASEDRMRRFVADASHELRTPLATVRGYAELYRQGAVTDPDDIGAAMRRIEGEAVRMSALVDNLLLLTRLDRSDREPDDKPAVREPVDLTVLAADAVQDAQARDRTRPMRLQGWDDQAVEPTTVVGDEAQLRQVLTNLLANALRYTPEGSPVEVLVGSGPQGALLAVRDHGPGIPAEQRHKVFERFYRGDSSRNTALGGSGLGLAIVQAIVGAMGGDVSVEETAGGGATFVVRLPQPPHRSAPEDRQSDPVN